MFELDFCFSSQMLIQSPSVQLKPISNYGYEDFKDFEDQLTSVQFPARPDEFPKVRVFGICAIELILNVSALGGMFNALPPMPKGKLIF